MRMSYDVGHAEPAIRSAARGPVPAGHPEVTVPDVRPFRALRYDPESVPDLSRVVSPPYDVITPAERARLASRDEHNFVSVELPEGLPGDEPQDRYRRAARALAAWRSEGILRKDARPSWYGYEQAYRVPGTDEPRTQRGYFGLVHLAPFGAEGGVLAHERTLEAPREDRYRLLRATGANTSPAVGLYEDPEGAAGRALDTVIARPETTALVDDAGITHRLWVVAGDDETVTHLAEPAVTGPVVIADGHHRYETALRYRDERRMTRSCEEDPPFDWLLMLLLSTTERVTILPTHRLLLDLGPDELAALPGSLSGFETIPVDRQRIRSRSWMEPGRGRFALVTRTGAWILEAGPSLRDATGASTVDRLDVSILGRALASDLGIDADAVAAGRLAYTTSVDDAIAAVDDGDADAAVLLAPTPVGDVLSAARAGESMPQKSTYFYPKAPAGLVLNPHEW